MSFAAGRSVNGKKLDVRLSMRAKKKENSLLDLSGGKKEKERRLT